MESKKIKRIVRTLALVVNERLYYSSSFYDDDGCFFIPFLWKKVEDENHQLELCTPTICHEDMHWHSFVV